MVSVVGLGAGGHAKVLIEILRLTKGYKLIGLLDPKEELWGKKILGFPVLDGDALLPDLFKKDIRHVFVGVGSTGDNEPRKQLYEKVIRDGFNVINLIHPNAIISPSSILGCGVAIMAGAVVNAGAHLGNNIIVNTGSIIEHDCILGDHVHIATGAKLASAVRVREGSHIGINACVRQGISIGRNSIIGAGAVVVEDVPDEVVVVGVPARILKTVEKNNG